MKKQKLMLPLAMLLCAFMFGTANAKVRLNGLIPYAKNAYAIVPYSVSYSAQLKQQRSTSPRVLNYSSVRFYVPSGQSGFRDWIVTLSQNGNAVYTFYTWQAPNFSWTNEWTLGEVNPGVYDVTVQCANDPSGGYYADVFWDCPDSNDIDQ